MSRVPTAGHKESKEKQSEEAAKATKTDLVRVRDKSRLKIPVVFLRWKDLGPRRGFALDLDFATFIGKWIIFLKCTCSIGWPGYGSCTSVTRGRDPRHDASFKLARSFNVANSLSLIMKVVCYNLIMNTLQIAFVFTFFVEIRCPKGLHNWEIWSLLINFELNWIELNMSYCPCFMVQQGILEKFEKWLSAWVRQELIKDTIFCNLPAE